MPLTHWLQTYKLKKVTSDHRQYSPKHLSQWTQNIKFLIVYLCQCLHSNHEPTPTIWRCQFLRKESRWYIKSFQQNGSRNIFTTSALVLPPIFSELLWGRGTGSQSRKDRKKIKPRKKPELPDFGVRWKERQRTPFFSPKVWCRVGRELGNQTILIQRHCKMKKKSLHQIRAFFPE